jgi:hypothetical protein
MEQNIMTCHDQFFLVFTFNSTLPSVQNKNTRFREMNLLVRFHQCVAVQEIVWWMMNTSNWKVGSFLFILLGCGKNQKAFALPWTTRFTLVFGWVIKRFVVDKVGSFVLKEEVNSTSSMIHNRCACPRCGTSPQSEWTCIFVFWITERASTKFCNSLAKLFQI